MPISVEVTPRYVRRARQLAPSVMSRSRRIAAREDVLSTGLSEMPYDHRNHEIPVEELDPIPEPEALNPDG